MLRRSLENLPLEILVQIFEVLSYEHPPSLLAVACTNKHCYSLTTPLLFRTIKIIYDGSQRLSIDVQGYVEMLSRSASFRHVRRLLICGYSGEDDEKLERVYKWQRLKTSRVERGESEESIFDLHTRSVDWLGTTEPIEELRPDWNPLSNFLKMLPGLTDLIFDRIKLIHPCILETLHHYRPQCRLHVDLSSLPCLYGYPVHTDELALLRSESLYAIKIDYREEEDADDNYQEEEDADDSDGTTSYHPDAIQQLVAGMTPNLREVYVYFNPARDSRVLESGPDSRKGLRLKNKGRILSQRPLTCLLFDNEHPITKDWMEDWAVSTDFSSLKILKLWSYVEEDTLKYLIVNHNLRSLHTLLLSMLPIYSRLASEKYHDTVARFLLGLPRLSKLTLRQWKHESLLGAVIPYHGPRLRKLSISPNDDESFTLENVKLLSTSCPLLEELELPLRRSKGDTTEVMTYQALGSLPSLRSLELTLDASNRSVLDSGVNSDGEPIIPDDPAFDEFDRAFFTGDRFSLPEMRYHGISRFPRNGHIRDTLVNSALDQTLAGDIFRAISSGKKPFSIPLERLSLTVKGGGDLGGDPQLLAGLIWLVQYISRPFTVERNLRDDRRDDLIIRRHAHTNYRIYSASGLITSYEKILRRIWPVRRRHRTEWWERWHSFPLAELPTSGSDA